MPYTETTVLHVYPAQQCAYCPRLTGVILTNRDQGIFSPVCPLHGYVEPFSPSHTTHAELCRQHESIRRFVVWTQGDQGRVTIVSPVHILLSIPGYQELAEQEIEDDRGFYAGYLSPVGEHTEIYAIWSAGAKQFFLYSDGKEYKDRTITL